MAKATFAAGHFWAVEETFRKVRGVTATVVGYMGGTVENPTADDVAGGESGHVEVVEVEYDTAKVTYLQLLEVFWACHDPTQFGRQGRDVGPQFRSVLFVHTPQQRTAAEHSKAMQFTTGRFQRPVMTRVEPAGTFWRAAEEQQRYYQKHGRPTG